jgi:hypothetical protein
VTCLVDYAVRHGNGRRLTWPARLLLAAGDAAQGTAAAASYATITVPKRLSAAHLPFRTWRWRRKRREDGVAAPFRALRDPQI